MVLDKLRTLGTPLDETAPSPPNRGGDPLTFPELLHRNRRVWGAKTAYQQKSRGHWERISHDDVYRRSYEMAAGLVAIGLEPGDRVALVAENGADWALAYYGTVLAGGTSVPIYYELKPAEIAGMIERTEAHVVVVSAKVLPKLVESDLECVRTIVVIGEAKATPEIAPASLSRRPRPDLLPIAELPARATPESRRKVAETTVRPDDVASVVFTSGTTGGSKGVMLTHRNFMANLRSIRLALSFSERDRVLMPLPLHHAFPFIVGIVAAPYVGGEVTFENDLRRLRDRMGEIHPTLFVGVPALFEVMYRNILHGIEAQGRIESFERALRIVETTKQRTGVNIGRIVFREIHKKLGGRLRFMVSGGAALNPELGLKFARIGIPVLQGWGLTESSPALTIQRWNPRKFYLSNYYEEHVGTVGQPVDGVEIGLIDVPEKELYVHLHGEGELVARGDNITPGYWQAEEETRAIKVDGWLRTGDVGYLDDEGNVWITGRSKYVIVLDSGEKVHPDEIEEKIMRSPVIQDVVATGVKSRGKVLVSAVIYPNRDEVLARLGDGAINEDAVRALVKSELDRVQADVAAYKRPTDIVLTDRPLPRTMGLRKVMRGQVAEVHEFDLRTWELSWQDVLDEAAAVPGSEESDEALVSA
jgi:long-chain acyl-CoA synthetase